MMRPFTCLCMIAAASAGLYLYQEKYRAQMLDREISGVIKQIDQSHDRINLLKAEWALLNQPDRLSDLASQHLSLQPLAPTQFTQLADLGSRLPSPAAPDAAPPAAPAPAVPMAQAAPPATVAEADEDDDDAPAPKVAAVPRPAPRPVEMAAATPAPRPAAPARPAPKPAAMEMAAATQHPLAAERPAAQPPAAPALRPMTPAAPSALQMAAAHPLPAPRRLPARRRPDETQLAAAETPRPYRPLYAPVMSAFASGASAQAVHPPTVQRAAAGFTEPAQPYVGSALGMAGNTMAPPVPIRGDR